MGIESGQDRDKNEDTDPALPPEYAESLDSLGPNLGRRLLDFAEAELAEEETDEDTTDELAE